MMATRWLGFVFIVTIHKHHYKGVNRKSSWGTALFIPLQQFGQLPYIAVAPFLFFGPVQPYMKHNAAKLFGG